jgi:glyoxylate utilization-related uncharacterized protein
MKNGYDEAISRTYKPVDGYQVPPSICGNWMDVDHESQLSLK